MLEKKKAERLTIKEIGNVLDIPIERINSWIRNNTEPKHNDGVKIENWLNDQFKQTSNAVAEEPVIYKIQNTADRYLDIIDKLTATNAEQQRTISTLVDRLGNAVAQTKVG